MTGRLMYGRWLTYICVRGLRYRLPGGLLSNSVLVWEAYLGGLLPYGVYNLGPMSGDFAL